jgi:hypothetical protein
MRLSKKPWVQIMIVLHEFNDVVMRLCIDHWICGKRIRTGKGLDDGIIDVGILGDCKGLVGGEETLEEGEKGWHIGKLVDYYCAARNFNFFMKPEWDCFSTPTDV